MSHDVGILQTDGKTKLIACVEEAIEEALDVFLPVGNKSSSIGKEQATEENLTDFGVGSALGRIGKFTIRSRVEEDSIIGWFKGVRSEHGERGPE